MLAGKLFLKLFKITIIVTSTFFVVYKVFNDSQRGVFSSISGTLSLFEVLLIVVVVLLMPINWLLEAIKFKHLVKPVQKITLIDSFKGVLAGVTVSIFTPKRAGDFGGRIFVLESKHRVSGIFATLLGSLSQLFITIAVGVMFFPLYFRYTSEYDFIKINEQGFLIFSSIFTVIIAVLYFNAGKIEYFIVKIRWLHKLTKFTSFIEKYNYKDLGFFALLSLLRYLVFTFQFFILLNIFAGDVNCVQSLSGISQIYLLMTLLPTFALGEVSLRSSVAIGVLSVFSISGTGIVVATTLLWIINIATPALWGSFYLYKFKM